MKINSIILEHYLALQKQREKAIEVSLAIGKVLKLEDDYLKACERVKEIKKEIDEFNITRQERLDERDKLIIKLRGEGKKLYEIADIMGLKHSYIKQLSARISKVKDDVSKILS